MKRLALTLLAWLPASLALAQVHWGDFPDGGTLYFYTNTIGQDGAVETPADETIAVYKDGSDTELTTGATIDDDVDSRTGFHRIAIDTTQSGFDAGSLYTIVYTAGTSDSVSVANRIIGSFYLGPKTVLISSGTGTGQLALDTGRVNANVVYFGGSAGAFSSGIPAVNVTAIQNDIITAATLHSNVTTELQNGLATASALSTLEGKVDTIDGNVDAILVDTAEIGAAGAGLTALASQSSVNTVDGIVDNMFTAFELDGSVYRFTANALEQAPAGGGGGSVDWTTGEKEQIRHRLGIDGDADAPSATPSLATAATLADVLEDTGTTIPGLIDALPTAAENTTAVWAGGTRTLTAGTNIVLAKGTGVTGFNDISTSDVLTQVSSGLGTYDAPTKAEMDSAVSALATAANLSTAQTAITAIQDKLPSDGANMAGEGATAKNLDQIEAEATIGEEAIEDIVDGVVDVLGDLLASAVSPDVVDPSRTWFAEEYRARNIVEVEEGFIGTLALEPDLNSGVTINTVSSVSITGAATVTATNLTVNRSKTRAHFTVPALTTTGTYAVVVTVTTVDGDTIPTTGTLKVN